MKEFAALVPWVCDFVWHGQGEAVVLIDLSKDSRMKTAWDKKAGCVTRSSNRGLGPPPITSRD